MSGRAFFVADDGECESFHRSARAPPATLRPAGLGESTAAPKGLAPSVDIGQLRPGIIGK
jgi:hypothetical protein